MTAPKPRTGGLTRSFCPSRAASTAAGNTNPQGIADPPAQYPIAAGNPRSDKAFRTGFDHRNAGVMAEKLLAGDRKLPASGLSPSYRAAWSVQGIERIVVSALEPIQDDAPFTDGLIPAGPLALRSHLTARKRRT